MICPNCAETCADDARFCWSCGQAVRVHSDERRVVTVLFADLVGFTALSETLDPEQVKSLVDRGFERLVRDIGAFGGRVDKIIGDAIVALFGAPVAHEDDAERAVRAGLRMQETLAAYAREVDVDIRMRVGVNTGEVLVGALRAGGDYTAMGDVVNTASRLQTSCEPGRVLVGESTHQFTKDVIAYESLGALVARGREQPVNVWVATGAALPPGYRPRRTRAPLVGRDGEVAILQNTVDLSIRHRRGQLMLLLGEAGVGKTRLANELTPIVEADRPEALILSGRCVPYGEANPWWPIAEAIRSGCGIELEEPLDRAREATRRAVGAMVDDVATVTTMVNGLLHLMGYEGPLRGLDPSRAKAEGTQALLGYLEASVRSRPVVMRLADLHWADDLVLELIDNLADQLARQPFVLIATARRGLLTRWSPRAGRHNVLLLNIEPLDRASSEELLEALLPDDVPAELGAALLDRAGGNPFFLEELVTLLSDGGSPMAVPGSITSGDLPDTLRGLLAARIDGLTPDEQLTLEDAAVWGASGPLEALHQLALKTRGAAEVGDVIASLHRKEILTVESDQWAFRSDLVREVAYNRLTKLDRLRRHHGIAQYLEVAVDGRFVDDSYVDTVARHYTEAVRLEREIGPTAGLHADLDERALRWLGEAARRAEQSAAWPLAARWYSQGIDLIGDEGDDAGSAGAHATSLIGFLLGRSSAETELWQFDEARIDARAALDVADATGDRHGRAEALTRLGAVAARDGQVDELDAVLDEAVELFDQDGDVHGRAEALRLRGMAALFRADNDAALGPVTAALAAFREVGDRRGEAWALQNLAWIAFATGRINEAEERLDQSAAAFEEIGDNGGMAWTLGLFAFVRFFQGRFDEARELGERILLESERRGDNWGQAMMLIVISAVGLWTGHTAEAVEDATRSVSLFHSMGDRVGLEQALAVQGRAMVMAGDVAAGRAVVRESVRAQEATSTLTQGGVSRVGEISIGIQLGDPSFVDDPGFAAVDWIDGATIGQADLLIALGLAHAQRGDAASGMALLDRAAGIDPDNGYLQAAECLVAAGLGRRHQINELGRVLLANPRATYLDRVYGWIGLGMMGAVGRDAAFASARRELAATGDELSTAVVALAESMARAGAGDPAAPAIAAEAARRWDDLGVDPVGWKRLFGLAVDAALEAV